MRKKGKRNLAFALSVILAASTSMPLWAMPEPAAVESGTEEEVTEGELGTEGENQDLQSGADGEIQDLQPGTEGEIQDVQPGTEEDIQDAQPWTEEEIQDAQPGTEEEIQDAQPGTEEEIQDAQPGMDEVNQAAEDLETADGQLLKAGRLGAPVLKSALCVDANAITVKWDKVQGASGYRIFRKTVSGSWKGLKNVGENTFSYTDKGLEPWETYTYTVRAYAKPEGAVVWGDYQKSGVRGKALPPVPVLTSAKPDMGGIQVSWKQTVKADGYAVYRKAFGTGWKRVGTVKSGSTTAYTDKTAVRNKTYIYTVRAYKADKAEGKNYYNGYDRTGLQVTYTVQPSMVKMDVGRAYTEYDVTGDGKKDTIKLKRVSLAASQYSEDKGLIIEINGKQCYRYDKAEMCQVTLCTVSLRDIFLAVNIKFSGNDVFDCCKLYQYKDGTLKMVYNPGYYFKGLDYKEVSVEKVSPSGIAYRWRAGLEGMPVISLRETCLWKNGKFSIKSRNFPAIYGGTPGEANDFTALRAFYTYDWVDYKTKAFSVAKNQRVQVYSAYIKESSVSLRIGNEKGQRGWVKAGIRWWEPDRFLDYTF